MTVMVAMMMVVMPMMMMMAPMANLPGQRAGLRPRH
jgi:hypothetical protein